MRTYITEPGRPDEYEIYRTATAEGVLTPENLRAISNIQRRVTFDPEGKKFIVSNLYSRDSSSEVYRYEINLEKFSIDQYANDVRTLVINPFSSLHYEKTEFFHNSE